MVFKALVVAGFSIDPASASAEVVDKVGFSTLFGAVFARLRLGWSTGSVESRLADLADMTDAVIWDDRRQGVGDADAVGVEGER